MTLPDLGVLVVQPKATVAVIQSQVSCELSLVVLTDNHADDAPLLAQYNDSKSCGSMHRSREDLR